MRLRIYSAGSLSQSQLRRGRTNTMLRLYLILILLTRIHTYITDQPTFANRLDKIFEKLENFTISPDDGFDKVTAEEKLYAKLDRLNSLTPEFHQDLNDEDEELLSAMQVWGLLSVEQLEGVVQELQTMKQQRDKISEFSEELLDEEIQDLAEGDYPMDGNEEWDDGETDFTTKPTPLATPSAFTKDRDGTGYREFMEVVSAIDPIAATNERPRILDDSRSLPIEKAAFRQAALRHISSVVRSSKCLTPQPRWMTVRQLAPAADTVYMPPCVKLHRCAPDSGCCYNDAEVCAPVKGNYVTLPFYLNKADGNFSVARMLFFNHTRCACVSRETLQSTVKTRIDKSEETDAVEKTLQDRWRDNQQYDNAVQVRGAREDNDWRPTEEPRLERDEETDPPQLRRCTCPTLFLAKITNDECSCVCLWADLNRRRDCLSLARGREHFSLRDRVCIANGDCSQPACEYGAYERITGRCPLRKLRRRRGRFQIHSVV